MRMLDLFSGIGGFALAAQRVWGDDLEIVSFCEMDKYCQRVLKKHWPKVPIVEDIRDVANTESKRRGVGRAGGSDTSCQGKRKPERTLQIDLLTGGFPCQPFSCAGKRDGVEDNRYLWPEMLRVIRTVQPTWVVAENVRGLLSIEDGVVFEQVCTNLESAGYEVQPFVIPAVAVDAHHRRDRVWFVAHAVPAGPSPERDGRGQQGGSRRASEDVANSIRKHDDSAGHGASEVCRKRGEAASLQGCSSTDAESRERLPGENKGRASRDDRRQPGYGRSSRTSPDTDRRGREERRGRQPIRARQPSAQRDSESERCKWLPEPDVGRVAHGISNRVDRLRALGNAIVPQVAEQIFRAIKEAN